MTAKTSRRSVLKYIAAAVGGLVVGGAAGWSANTVPTPPPAKFGEAPPAGTQVTVIHGFDAAYPPFTKVDPSGTAVGFDVDIVHWIANKYGWTIVEKPWDWSAIVVALQKGDLDIIASGMTETAERDEKIWFSIPYYHYIHQLLTLATQAGSMSDILNSGKPIACQLGATSEQWATKLIAAGDNFTKLGLDSYELAFEAVLDGRAVAAISDSAFTGPYFKSNPDKAAMFRVVGTVGGLATYAIAIRPTDGWLRHQIDVALEELMASLTWDELSAKWNVV